ncbi:MAG: F0F1 ATP synthase subunit delta [Alloprevotella sp.]|nr:F0F1 ATP synthase subunit delta [Alloprevotella sp.]MBR1595015.1 F0F1 ATP synthase subunit delta [Alloprevotella sp.]MBR1652356.1 F0F1 ATP synthase subunit delta [Alloprevotella sp.]
MDIGIISSRYARTLLRFATENGEAERVCREMQTLAQSFRDVPGLQQALLSPVLTAAQKEALLVSAAVGGGEATHSARRFLRLVTRNRRADLMTFIAPGYVRLYQRSQGIVRGRLVLSAGVSQATADKLRRMVEARTQSRVEFTTETDPALGGGFLLEYDTYRLDASLRTQMQELRRSLR